MHRLSTFLFTLNEVYISKIYRNNGEIFGLIISFFSFHLIKKILFWETKRLIATFLKPKKAYLGCH
jgi:hypothetical protein